MSTSLNTSPDLSPQLAAETPVPRGPTRPPVEARVAGSSRRLRAFGWGLMTFAALGIALYAVLPTLSVDPADSRIPINPDVALHALSLAVHALPGGLALIIGPFQFLSRLRRRWPALHRYAGRVYMVSVVVAAVVALAAALFSVGGLAAQIAFVLLAVMWVFSLAQAYLTIRRGQVELHRVWMIRNYALTFTAVALRLFLLLGLLVKQAVPLPFDQIYTASAWSAIVINVVVAEYFIVQTTLSRLLRRAANGRTAAVTPPA